METQSPVKDLFEATAKNFEENTAIEILDKSISYKELNSKSNLVANYIINQKIQNEFVGICIDRSIEMVIFILGILKSGNIYFPLISNLPEQRMKFMFNETKCKLVFTNSSYFEIFQKVCSKEGVISIEDLSLDKFSKENPKISISPDVGCVIFTSGSTGTPKGVLICKKGIVSLAKSTYLHLNLEVKDKYASFAEILFTVHISDIFCPLLSGMTLVIIPQEIRYDPVNLMDYVNKRKINALHIPPVVLKMLPKIPFEHKIKFLRVGGEVPDEDSLKYWSEKVRMINSYGMTETGGPAIIKVIDPKEKIIVENIGKPLPEVQAFVLNECLEKCKVNEVGELFIAGKRIAKEYLNLPNVTKSKFKMKGKMRLLCTGDLCKRDENGDIIYCGRIDSQEKIRGFRINLKEINNVIMSTGLVKAACVVMKRDQLNNKRLVGFITPLSEEKKNKKTTDKIKELLLERLPDYEVPNNYCFIDEIPKNFSGKVDKKKLISMKVEFSSEDFISPRNEVEKKLSEILKDMLNVEKIGIHDDFFDLGGNSLLVAVLAGKLRKEFDVDVKGPNLLNFAITIENLSKVVQKKDRPKEDSHMVKLLKEFRDRKFVVDWSLDPPILYRVATEDDLVECSILIGKVFSGEPLSKSIGVTTKHWSDCALPTLKMCYKETVVAVNRVTNQIICCFSGISPKVADAVKVPKDAEEALFPIYDMIKLERYVPKEILDGAYLTFNLVGKPNIPHSVELTVSFFVQELGRLKGFKFMIGETSSPVTTAVVRDLGVLKAHAMVPFKEYQLKNGSRPFENTQEDYLNSLDDSYMSKALKEDCKKWWKGVTM